MRQYRSFREHIRRGNAEARVDQDEKLSPEARRKEGVARLKSRIWRPAGLRKGRVFWRSRSVDRSGFFTPIRNRSLPGRHITDCQMRSYEECG